MVKSNEFAVGLAVPPGQKKQQGAVGIIVHDLPDRASDAQPPFFAYYFQQLDHTKSAVCVAPADVTPDIGGAVPDSAPSGHLQKEDDEQLAIPQCEETAADGVSAHTCGWFF